VLTLAVEAGYLTTNPADGVRAPRQPEPQMLFLDADQVDRLASAIQEPYGTLVYVLTYGGLRWGEAAALRRGRCELAPSRIIVAESVSEAGGELHFGPTKNHRSRIVGIPAFLRDLLDNHLDQRVPDDPDALAFTSPQGAPLRNSNFRRQVWYTAVEQAGLPEGLRIHDLRHTCASLLIAAGANPTAVQVPLGHSSISVTMDRYTHLFPSDVEALIGRLEGIRARNLAAQPRPNERSRGIDIGGR
jgi:integrase